MATLDIDVTPSDDHVRIALAGDIDLTNTDQLLWYVQQQLRKPEINHVTADLAGLAFIDSSGLRALVFSRRLADSLGKTFRIQGQHGQIARLVEVTGLTELLTEPNDKPLPGRDQHPGGPYRQGAPCPDG